MERESVSRVGRCHSKYSIDQSSGDDAGFQILVDWVRYLAGLPIPHKTNNNTSKGTYNMVVVEIPSSITYSNLYTLSGFDAGVSLILTNNTSTPAFIVQASVPPLASSDQYPLLPGQTVLVHANANPVWVRGGKGPFLVQSLLETITPFSGVDLPHDVWTWDSENFRRLRVDTSQTSFFTGYQGRTFKEFSIASGATYLIMVTVPVETVLWNVNLSVDAGAIKLSTYVGGTPSITLTDTVPVVPKNTMTSRPTPFYTLQNQLIGGTATLTGGILIDVVRVATAGATAQQISVGSSPFSERGVGLGTYFWVFNNYSNGTATGTFSSFWEERP